MLHDIDLHSSRARRARYHSRIGKTGYLIFRLFALIGFAGGGLLWYVGDHRLAYLALAAGLIFVMLAFWYAQDLSKLPPKKVAETLDDILAPEVLTVLAEPLSPKAVAQTLKGNKQVIFLLNHLFISPQIFDFLSDKIEHMPLVWQKSVELQSAAKAGQLGGGTIMAALILTNEHVMDYCASLNLRQEDILEVHAWLMRLVEYTEAPKPYFGGFGRDWATGFTPLLDRFGSNISRSVEMNGGHLHFLSDSGLHDTIIHGLSGGSGVAILGDAGAGKTTMVYALAERLLEGKDPELKHYQIISLNASSMISAAGDRLEELLLRLFGEVITSGNKIIFLDDAELFFGQGVGAFDMSQVLLPVLQNRNTRLIAAFTPGDFQRLKARNGTLANLFTPVTLADHPKEDIMKILQDSALLIEGKTGTLVTYDAVREAYRLGEQYLSDQAFPGKGIDLMEQAAPFADDKVVLAKSVQTALEKTRGVKAGGVEAAESDTLLNLEDLIHDRMINQTRAVSVVAGALRRARAGVSSTNRPMGSFLFLGPTGVGKTELARSLAAVYFGDEKQMIRLDMSEYQQESDVSRVLDSGSAGSESLIMSIRKQPFSVVLLDEVEKAHPNILNLLLQLLDEGQLTDVGGKVASFRNAIIIATSNAGAPDISARVAAGEDLESFERPLIDKLIADGQFKPELINRFDEVVLFRPLKPEELTQVAKLMLGSVNRNLAQQNMTVELTDAALAELVKAGYDPQFGARPMRRVLQKSVEDVVAQKILRREASPGSTIKIDLPDLQIQKDNAQ